MHAHTLLVGIEIGEPLWREIWHYVLKLQIHRPLAQQSFWQLIPQIYLHTCEVTHGKVIHCININNSKSIETTKNPSIGELLISWGTHTLHYLQL